MRLSALCLALAVACLLNGGNAASAQSSRGSVDLAYGIAHRTGGAFGHPDGFTVDLAVARRLGEVPSADVVGAIVLGVDGFPSTGSACIGGASGCLPNPGFARFALLVGLQRNGSVDLRAMLGPAFYAVGPTSLFDDAGGGGGSAALEGRVDLAVPLVRHLALVVGARGGTFLRLNGKSVDVGAVSAGLRIH